MDGNFLECCYNSEHWCVGLKLKPYSLSHLLALEAIESPLVIKGPVKAKDLMNAARICASVQFHPGPKSFRWTKLTLCDHFRVGLMRRNEPALIGQIQNFVDYRDDYVRLPEFWENEGNGESLTGPYVLAQAVQTMLHFPQLSEARVWTMPLGLLLWYSAQVQECKFRARFFEEGEEDEIEEYLQQAENEITPEMRAFAAKLAAGYGKASGDGGLL